MKYYRYMYLQEGLEKKKDKILEKLSQNKFQRNLYLIVLAENEKNQLEILNAMLFMQKDYPVEEYLVIGLSQNHEDALEIVEKITQEVYDSTKGADIRSYLLQREQEG